MARKAKNPAVSGKQFRLAEAVLSGYSDAMPKSVARDLIAKTPSKYKSMWNRKTGRGRNPEDFATDIEDSLTKAAERIGIIGARRDKGKVTLDDVKKLATEFHGRAPRDIIEYAEQEHYQSKLFVMGELEELNVLKANGKGYETIRFKSNGGMGVSTYTGENDDTTVLVCAQAVGGNQIEFVGGDQELEFSDKIVNSLGMDPDSLNKEWIEVGDVFSITYFTDKHHLEGPKYQANGTSYEHEFGEEGGSMPVLFYNFANSKLYLAGGSYTVKSEGISN